MVAATQTTLYGVPISPFVRKVRVLLAHKQIDYEFVLTRPHDKAEPFQSLSPCGKIPVFTDDQVVLPDSVASCAYLEARYPNNPVYPNNPADYAKAIWLEQFANNELSRVINPKILWAQVVGPLFFGQPKDDAVTHDAMTVDLPPLFAYLESQLTSSYYFIGNIFSIADMAVGSMLLGIYHAGFHIDPATCPRLANFMEHFLQHPIVATLWREECNLLEKAATRGVPA